MKKKIHKYILIVYFYFAAKIAKKKALFLLRATKETVYIFKIGTVLKVITKSELLQRIKSAKRKTKFKNKQITLPNAEKEALFIYKYSK